MTKGLFDPYVPDDNNNHQEDTSQEFADWDDNEAWENLEADLQILLDILEDEDNNQN